MLNGLYNPRYSEPEGTRTGSALTLLVCLRSRQESSNCLVYRNILPNYGLINNFPTPTTSTFFSIPWSNLPYLQTLPCLIVLFSTVNPQSVSTNYNVSLKPLYMHHNFYHSEVVVNQLQRPFPTLIVTRCPHWPAPKPSSVSHVKPISHNSLPVLPIAHSEALVSAHPGVERAPVCRPRIRHRVSEQPGPPARCNRLVPGREAAHQRHSSGEWCSGKWGTDGYKCAGRAHRGIDRWLWQGNNILPNEPIEVDNQTIFVSHTVGNSLLYLQCLTVYVRCNSILNFNSW